MFIMLGFDEEKKQERTGRLMFGNDELVQLEPGAGRGADLENAAAASTCCAPFLFFAITWSPHIS